MSDSDSPSSLMDLTNSTSSNKRRQETEAPTDAKRQKLSSTDETVLLEEKKKTLLLRQKTLKKSEEEASSPRDESQTQEAPDTSVPSQEAMEVEEADGLKKDDSQETSDPSVSSPMEVEEEVAAADTREDAAAGSQKEVVFEYVARFGTNKSWEAIKAMLDNKPECTVCHISYNYIRDEGWGKFAKYLKEGKLPNLKTLNLAENKIRNTGFKNLVEAVGKSKTIRHFNCSGNEFGSTGVDRDVEGFQDDTSLEELIMQRCKLSNTGCKKLLQKLGQLKSLKRLDLSGNWFADPAPFVKLMENCKSLEYLSLTGNFDAVLNEGKAIDLTALTSAAQKLGFTQAQDLVFEKREPEPPAATNSSSAQITKPTQTEGIETNGSSTVKNLTQNTGTTTATSEPSETKGDQC